MNASDIIVDPEDAHLLAERNWHLRKWGPYWYAQAQRKLLHRVIVGATRGQLVDHINRNGLDNRRANLRIATHSQNHANAPRRSDNRSCLKGVSWDEERGKWLAKITCNKKQIPLGRYRSSMEAAAAYDGAALKYFGEFALTNEALGLTSSAGGTY